MTKQVFLAELRKKLRGLPERDIEDRLTFYDEMIDDRKEEGLSEAEAVAAIGSIDQIARHAIADTPLIKIAQERIRPKRSLKAWEITLLAVGSPVWLSLAIAAVAVLCAVYVSLWSAVAALWAAFGVFAVGAVASVPVCVIFIVGGSGASGVALLAAGMVCAGLSVLTFYGCMATTKGIIKLTKAIAVWVKMLVIKKEEA